MIIPNYQRAVEPTAHAAAHLGRATMKRTKDQGLVWDLVLQWEAEPEQVSGLSLPESIAYLRPGLVVAVNGGGAFSAKRNLSVAGKATLAWLVDGEVVRWQRDPFAAVVRYASIKAAEKRVVIEQCVRVVGKLGEHIEDLFDSTLIVGFTPAQGELLAGPRPKAAETIPPEPEDDSEDEDDDGEESNVRNYEAPNARSRRRRP